MCPTTLVLLVDADADAREATAFALSAAMRGGCDVMHAGDGRAALVLARTRRPDVVVAELAMPILDGAELVAHLRADPHLRGVPVLLVSDADDLARAASTVGADAHISRPYSAVELVREVERLGRSARRREGAVPV